MIEPGANAVAHVSLTLDSNSDCSFITNSRRLGHDPDTIFFDAAMHQLDRLIHIHAVRRRHVVIASFPKSASTYLNALLVRATGFLPHLLNTRGHDTERNIDRLSIPMFLARDTVSQEHMRATQPNVRLLKQMRIKPIVLVRNVFDVIVASRDHALQESMTGPAAHVPGDFRLWSKDRQLWLCARMATPWLLSMYTSWCDASSALDVLWITYDDVTSRPCATLRRILHHASVDISVEALGDAVNDVKLDVVRFNRGVSGRGAQELSAYQILAIREIAACYADIYDLSLIGLS